MVICFLCAFNVINDELVGSMTPRYKVGKAATVIKPCEVIRYCLVKHYLYELSNNQQHLIISSSK